LKRFAQIFKNTENYSTIVLVSYCTFISIPLLYKPYFWADSFSLIASDNRVTLDNSLLQVVQNFRPFYALFLHFSGEWFRTTGDLRLMIIAMFTGAIYFSLLLIRILIFMRFSRLFASFVVLLFLVLPTFQNYFYDPIMWPMTWTAALVLKAYLLVNSEGTGKTWIALCLLIVCSLVYQPIYTFFIFLIFLKISQSLLLNRCAIRDILKAELATVIVFIRSAIISVGIGSLTLFLYDIERATRSQFLGDLGEILEKVKWVGSVIFATFVRPFATNTLSMFILVSSIVGLCYSLLVLYESIRLSLRDFLGVMLIPIGGVTSIFPLLIVSQNQFEFRSIPGLGFASLLWLMTSMKILFQKLKLSVTNKHLVTIIFTTLMIFNSYLLSRELWITPTTSRDVVLSQVKEKAVDVCLVIPKEADSRVKRMGIYSLRTDLVLPWVIENLTTRDGEKIEIERVVSSLDYCGQSRFKLDMSDSFNKDPKWWLY